MRIGAADFYARAKQIMPPQDDHALLPARLMTAYYRAILSRIARADFQVFKNRISLGRLYKLTMLALFWPRLMISRWQEKAS